METNRNGGKKDNKSKQPCYLAGCFLLFWVLLFFAVVIPFCYRLPTALTMEDAKRDVFVAERAYRNLFTLSGIGTKMIGSKENEVLAVEFLLKEINQIKQDSLKDYFDMEIDLSQVSGQFQYKQKLSVYQGVQNLAVKLSAKNSSSESYLLVNCHFDSKPATSSAGDAGFMVVTMLEVLRIMATTRQTFDHPIVFLFNGAEESSMLASHGFINQHKWAKKCKAVVNLDASGSGGREVLFQTGPQNAWLLDYYAKYAKYPFATSLGEELYQSGLVPSDSDFTIFKQHMPGLDFAQTINGFIYHTKYDLIDVIPRASLQNTDDNALSIIRGLSNASELNDVEAHNNGNVAFFDFLGIYFVHYSEATGTWLCFGIAATALLLIFISIWRMAALAGTTIYHVLLRFILVLVIQVIGFVFALALPIVVAAVFDSCGLPLTWFCSSWLVIGLYACPALIGLSVPFIIYNSGQCTDKYSAAYHLQLALHAQAVILSILAMVLASIGFRSTYFIVIPVLCYIASLAFNLLSFWHDRGYTLSILVTIGQIFPFLLCSYLFYLMFVILAPMQGRSGSSSNPDLIVALVVTLGTILSFSFLLPLINSFRCPSLAVYCLLLVSAVTMFLASSTQVGFPYRPKTHGHRAAYLQVRNMFYEYDGKLSSEESGYLFLYQDRREEKALQGSNVNLTGLISIKPNCERHMMCGMPLYDFRYVQHRLRSKWLPRSTHITLPSQPRLLLLSKRVLNQTTVRFEFNLTGPAQMSLFLQANEDVKIADWSFLRSYLDTQLPHQLSHHIFFNYGIDSSPLNFFVELTKSNGNFKVPLFQLGVSGHYIGSKGDNESIKFASTFPSYAIQATWPALYQRFIF